MRVSGLFHVSTGLLLTVVLPGEALAQYDFPIEEWVVRFDGLDHGPDEPVEIVVDDQGCSYVCGTEWVMSYGHCYRTNKYDTDGVQVFFCGYSSSGNDYATDIAIDSACCSYMTGNGEVSGHRIVTTKTSPSGAEIWFSFYPEVGTYGLSGGNAVAVDEAGNVYVTGYMKPYPAGDYDYITLKYNSSGVLQWASVYNGPENGSDQACDLEVDAAGNVYVTGVSMGSSSEDYATIKYNSAGVLQWVARYEGPGGDSDSPCGIELDSYGNVYVTGESPNNDYCEIATVKYSNSGAQLWVATYHSGSTIAFPTDIGIGPDGSIYVAGEAENDLLVLKYQSSGALSWSRGYGLPIGGEDCANALAIDASGDVFVTGFCLNGPSDNDYLTVRYSSSGQFMWAATYDGIWGGLDDEACAIALDGGDGIYITGMSFNGGTSQEDFATIKYDANTGVEESPGSPSFDLLVSPNPASSAIAVVVSLEEASDCEVRVFDFQGRIVDTVRDGGLPAGRNQLTWDAQDFPAGLYFIRAENGGRQDTERLVLIR